MTVASVYTIGDKVSSNQDVYSLSKDFIESFDNSFREAVEKESPNVVAIIAHMVGADREDHHRIDRILQAFGVVDSDGHPVNTPFMGEIFNKAQGAPNVKKITMAEKVFTRHYLNEVVRVDEITVLQDERGVHTVVFPTNTEDMAIAITPSFGDHKMIPDLFSVAVIGSLHEPDDVA